MAALLVITATARRREASASRPAPLVMATRVRSCPEGMRAVAWSSAPGSSRWSPSRVAGGRRDARPGDCLLHVELDLADLGVLVERGSKRPHRLVDDSL